MLISELEVGSSPAYTYLMNRKFLKRKSGPCYLKKVEKPSSQTPDVSTDGHSDDSSKKQNIFNSIKYY